MWRPRHADVVFVMALAQTASFKDSPRRAPHWRWLRAVEIDGGGHRATRATDGADGFTWIRRAVRFKRHYAAVDSADSSRALHTLMLRDKDLFWAHSIWVDDKNPTRWAIEARIVAGETDEEIADKIGAEPEVVAAFANVFFNVRDKLENPDYVCNVIMADAVTRGLQERHYDLLWKLLAHKGGPHVLDVAVGRVPGPAKPESADGVSGFLQDFAINAIRYKAALAAVTVPVNSHTQLPLLDLYVKYVEIERTTENASKAQTSIIDNIGTMLTSLPFRVGTKLDSKGSKMLPFDDGAAELRGNEMMILAAGGKLQDTDVIQKLNFPGE